MSYLDDENKVNVDDPTKRHSYLYTYQIVKEVKLIDFSNLTTSKIHLYDVIIRWTTIDDDYNCAKIHCQ